MSVCCWSEGVDTLIPMFPGDDLDALAVAREQLRYAMIVDPRLMTLELRLQLGLLAAQVALAERLPEAKRRNLRDDDEEFVWTVEAVEKFLDRCATSAVQMIRCLADEGGAATPSRLKELTGAKSLAGITNSIRRTSSDMWRNHFPEPTLVEICHTKPPHRVVTAYRLAEDTLPLVVEAFERLDARNARIARLPQ